MWDNSKVFSDWGGLVLLEMLDLYEISVVKVSLYKSWVIYDIIRIKDMCEILRNCPIICSDFDFDKAWMTKHFFIYSI